LTCGARVVKVRLGWNLTKEAMLRSIFIFIVGAALLSFACGSPGKAVCAKAKECCSRFSACEDINKEGEGFEDRCGIAFAAQVDALGTYNKSECDKIASAFDDYYSCLGGVECTDINDAQDDRGHVSKCDTQAKAYCNALQASGDACGHDYKNYSCDNYKARMSY
jgi:hypothetical protein